MNVAGKSALVVGMAKSGVACARLLAEEGARVTINDVKPAAELAGVLDALKDLSFADALGKDPMTLLDGCDLLVLSPGVMQGQFRSRDIYAALQHPNRAGV